MLEYISDLRVFHEVCKTLNFREAGKHLGYSPAIVTMRIKRLEETTGRTLFIRTTRHVSLTAEGKEFLELSEKILDLTELMGTPADSDRNMTQLKGTVRISAPHSFARLFLVDPIQHITQEHPNLSIELILEDSLTNLTKEGIDISFRIGNFPESTMEYTDLFEDKRIILASPDYLKKHGTPKTANDLKNHYCLSYMNMKHWTLHKNKQSCKITLPKVTYCNTGDYIRQLAIAGAGITVKSAWSVQNELDNGTLIHILPEYTLGEPSTVKMLVSKRDVVPLRIQYVSNIITKQILSHMK